MCLTLLLTIALSKLLSLKAEIPKSSYIPAPEPLTKRLSLCKPGYGIDTGQ